MTHSQTETGSPTGRAAEVFGVFLKLGLTSFGGPIAHLGYFRDEFVARRGWLDDADYADLVALCQILPGPSSSQTGFALGLMRAGWAGALAAFAGFTLPSAVLMVLFAVGLAGVQGPVAAGALAGLKLVAVAVVAQAVLGMARVLCPDRKRATIAAAAVAWLALWPGASGMVAAILAGLLAGLVWLPRPPVPPLVGKGLPLSPRIGIACLGGFALLMLALPLLAGLTQDLAQGLAVFDAFFRAGALVFGGGHVVLPLLDAEIVQRGWITPQAFLAGYSAAQAVPGPLFTFAAYLGWGLHPAPHGAVGAAIALTGIFLPGFLLVAGVMPFWQTLRRASPVRAALDGANAAVVGLLGAALWSPVTTETIHDLTGLALALGAFVALVAWRAPVWLVVLGAMVTGAAMGGG